MQKTIGSVYIKRYMCNHFNVHEPVFIIDVDVGKN